MQKRYILWWMMCFLLICNTLVTLNIDIAIVSMVNFRKNGDNSRQSSNIVCPNSTFFLKSFLDPVEAKASLNPKNEGYNWSVKEQSMVLGGYYWLNYISILPGGILAHKFGSKVVVGYAQFISSAMSSLIPILAGYGPMVVAYIRAAQGLLSFMSVPAGMSPIIGRWSPPQERATFWAGLLAGSCFGQALSSFCFGYIAEYMQWEYIFYLTSICGIIWCIFWYMLVNDFPSNHPTITQDEKEYIESSLRQTNSSTIAFNASIPWKKICNSVPVITCMLARNATMWMVIMSLTYTPIYLKSIYGLNSNEIGLIMSFPQLCSCAAVLLIGYYSDVLVKNKILSLTAMRKSCTLIGTILASIPLIVIAFTNCNINLVLSCILTGSLLQYFGHFGPPLAIFDISPKFCGILEGISATSSSLQMFIHATLISYFSGILSTENLWNLVFTFTALFSISMNLIYIIFGSSNVQPWNDNS